MKDKYKAKEQLINELLEMRRRAVELEASKAEHKWMEETLRESEAKYRELADLLPQVVFEADKRGKITLFNRKGLEFCGYTQQDLERGLNIFQMLIPGDRDRARKNMQRRLRGENFGYTEYTALKKDGSTFPVIIYSSPIIHKNKTVGLRGIAADVTERKQAEEALRKSEEMYRDLVERMIDVIYTLDKAGNVTSVNKAVKNLLGVKPEQVIGRVFTKWIPKQALPQAMADFKQVLKGKKITSETILVDKDGNPHNVEFSSTPIIEDGKVVGTRGIIRDITQRKQAEEALKESESKLRKQKMALEQKNVALREIVAQIEIEKNRIKEDIATNVNELLLPILAKLKMKEINSKYVDLIKHHLQELASPFGRKITKKSVRLTPREIEICALIKGGLTSKETAKLLSPSCKTVEKHRRNIRRKLRIANKTVNLASFLNTL